MKKVSKAIVSFIFTLFLFLSGLTYSFAENLSNDHLRSIATEQSVTLNKVFGDLRKIGDDGGKALEKVGFVYKTNAAERVVQLKTLIPEIDKELKTPGSGDLPWYAVISDFHGDHVKMSNLVSVVLAELLPGFKEKIGSLDPEKKIKDQIDAAGLSLKEVKGVLELNGDLFDRGKNGIRCFLIALQLKELLPADKFVYIRGNHCFWAQNNIEGRHLPFYDGFNFYGDKVAEDLIKEYRDTEEYKKYFDVGGDVDGAKLWWAARLVEYNKIQEAYENDFKFEDGLTGKEKLERFVAAVDKYSEIWTKDQQDAMENFAGYFKSISVPDPAIGLRAVFKTSTIWWQNLHKQLGEVYTARKNAGADAQELAIWAEAIRLSRQLSDEVGSRSQDALQKGQWWYRIFESINTQAYSSLEWWAKDWSSHSGWGLEVFKEINNLIDLGLLEGQKIDETNYFTHPILQEFAKFVGEEPRLYFRTSYNVLISHGGFPVNSDGSTSIPYNGKEYKNEEAFRGLDDLALDTRLGHSFADSWEAVKTINDWYGDATTRLKPNNWKDYVKIGIAKINSNLGINYNVVGHNIIEKLGFGSVIDGIHGLFAVDNGMSPKFGSRGEALFIGPNGVYSVGYETDKEGKNEVLKTNPKVIKKDGKVIDNDGLDAKTYLNNIKKGLSRELLKLRYNNGKLNVVISGGSGGIGAFIGDRIDVKGNVNKIIGSRSANLEADVFENSDAASIADMILMAVPADADKLESTIKTLSETIKDNTIVVSLAVPMGVDENKNKIHAPAGEYNSAAEMTAALFEKYAPGKNIKVVSALHQVPAEWHGDPGLILNQKVIVLGDDKEACDQVSAVIKGISNLEPVYKGKLSDSAFAEMVTPWIIQSNKELLEGRTLEEIYNFIKARNGQVSYDQVMAFNREVLDAQLKIEFGDEASLQKDMQSLFDEKISEGNKEKIAIRLNRFSQITTAQQAQVIAPVLQLSAINLANDIVFKKLSDVEFEGLVNVVGNVKRAKGAIAVSANAIFENVATLTALKAFKAKQPNIKIIVWANKDDVFAKQFKALDVMKVADLVSIDGLEQAVKKLEDFGITANQVVVINSAVDVEKLNKEFNVENIEQLLGSNSNLKGIKFIQLSKPVKAEDGKSLDMNDMLLAVSKAYAELLGKDKKVVQKYKQVVGAAADKHKMSPEDVKKLEDLNLAVSEMKTVNFVNKDEVARKQNSYAATVTKL